MSRYLAILFSDLERHSAAWSEVPRERMVAFIAEYRYQAESLASQYGSVYLEWAGDGHMYLFENADVAARFGLKLIQRWRTCAELDSFRAPHIPVRVGCHFGECTPIGSGEGWIGRANAVAKRVESEAEPDTLYVTEDVLDLLDLPLYTFEAAGPRSLKGDVLPQRALYRILGFDQGAFDAKPPDELTDQEWFLKAAGLIGTPRENSEEEAACYQHALLLRPDFAEAHTNLAVILQRRGQLGEAAQHYQEALRLRPDYPEAHYNYATLLGAKGSAAGALRHYQDALRLRPDYIQAHHGLANLLREASDAGGAELHYLEVLRLRPEYAEAHNNLAGLLEEKGRPQEAIEHYRRALRLRPNYPEAHYNFALLLESMAEADRAEEHYVQALHFWPEYAEAHNNLAALLHLRGDLAQAEHHYREALRLRPDDPEAHYNYGLLLRGAGRGEEGDRQLQIALELAPSEPRFRSTIEPPA